MDGSKLGNGRSNGGKFAKLVAQIPRRSGLAKFDAKFNTNLVGVTIQTLLLHEHAHGQPYLFAYPLPGNSPLDKIQKPFKRHYTKRLSTQQDGHGQGASGRSIAEEHLIIKFQKGKQLVAGRSYKQDNKLIELFIVSFISEIKRVDDTRIEVHTFEKAKDRIEVVCEILRWRLALDLGIPKANRKKLMGERTVRDFIKNSKRLRKRLLPS